MSEQDSVNLPDVFLCNDHWSVPESTVSKVSSSPLGPAPLRYDPWGYEWNGRTTLALVRLPQPPPCPFRHSPPGPDGVVRRLGEGSRCAWPVLFHNRPHLSVCVSASLGYLYPFFERIIRLSPAGLTQVFDPFFVLFEFIFRRGEELKTTV